MARTVKEQDYAAKRNEILDAAQRLIAAKGYEQMTIQDLLDALRMSKGALYHYFDSKQAVLEGLIDLLLERVEQRFLPVMQDSTLSALDKLQHFFTTLVEWKTEQRPMTLALLHVWYLDENAVYRQRLREMRVKRFAPRLEVILRQGQQEGSMTPSYPDQTGRVILSLVEDLSDTLARLLLSREATPDDALLVERVVAASVEAVERVLGVPSNSLSLVNAQALSVWMASSGDHS